MIKAIIFDCFGVVYLDRFDLIYKHFGGNIEADKDIIESIFLMSVKELLTVIIQY